MKIFYQIVINMNTVKLSILFSLICLTSSSIIACSITSQPATTQTVCQNSAPSNISITAGGTGTINYQWYSNTSNNNTGGTLIPLATNAVFAPPTSTANTRYYYCVVSGTCGASVTSNTSAVIVTPVTAITTQPAMAQTVCQNTAPTNISVVANGTGTLTYQWYSNAINANTGGTLIGSANASIYTPQTANTGTIYYYCIVGGNCGPSVTSSPSEVTITPATSISTQPIVTQTVCQNFTPTNLSIVAAGTGTVNYQWYSNTTNSKTGGTLINLATNPNYTPSTSTAGTLYYYCIVSSSCGSLTSNTSTVIVNPQVTITTQPLAKTPVCQNSTFNATVVAMNNSGYQWQKNGVNVSSGTGGTTASYSLANIQASDTGIFRVLVKGLTSCPDVFSTNDTLTVNTLAVITTAPSAFQICEDQSINITGAATNAASYQWLFNGLPITAPNGTAQNYTKGGNTATMSDNGMYRLVALTASAGATVCKADTSAAVLGAVVRKIQITTQPLAMTRVCQNSSFNASIVANNVTSYQWRKNSANVSIGTGGNSANYSISSAQPSDAGIYTVLMTGNTPCPNVTSTNDTLQVTTLVAFIVPPAAFTVCEDQPISIAGSATNAAGYKWLFNGNPISAPNGTAQNYTKGGALATMSDSGMYRLVALSANAGATVCKADTSAPVLGSVRRKIQITTQPAPLTRLCQNAPFNASVIAQNVTSYQWRRDGTPAGFGTGGNTANYSISSAQPSQSGIYTVFMTGIGPCPSVTSSNDTLQVTPLATITTPPVGFLVCEDQSISITGSASNAASYQWLFNGSPIAAPNGNVQTYTKGGNTAAMSDSGMYRLVALSGMAGATACKADTSAAVLGNVIRKVVITTQPPANSIACVGLNFNMSVFAQNVSGYSWRLNGNPIGQTTATMSRTPFAIADTGTYTVVISGNTPCPSLTSANAKVTGTMPALITLEPAGKNLCLGDSLELSVTSIRTQFYQWRKNGVNIGSPTTSNKFKISSVGYSDSATYSVIAIAFNGCINDTSALAIVKVRRPISITTPLANSDVKCIGQNIIYTIGVAGSGPYNYTWTFNGTNIGTNNATYTKNGASLADSGRYIVQIQGDVACPSVRDTIDLSIERPLAISLPLANSDVKCEGQNISYTVDASGVGPFTYSWRRNGTSVGTNNANYAKNGVLTSDSGRYIVQILGGGVCPAIFDTIDLDVNKAPVIVTQPSGNAPFCIGSNIILSATAANQTLIEWHKQGQGFLNQTGNNYVSTGSTAASAGNYFIIAKAQPACTDVSSNLFNVTMTNSMVIDTQPVGAQLLETPPGSHTLSVKPSGSGPFAYQWFRNGVIVPLANASTYTIANYVEAIDSGSYQVRITAPAPCNNVVFSNIVRVSTIKCPKTVNTLPAAMDLCAGSALNINATASGTIAYQWYKNNVALTGETNAILSISNTSINNTGVYKCMLFAQNTASCSNIFTSNIVVTIKEKPLILTQPQGPKLCEVTTHTLRVNASNVETYQWYRNGAAIATIGDKDSFVVNSINNTGDTYYVEVKNNVCPGLASSGVTIKSLKPSTNIFLANNSEFDLLERCTDENDWTYYSNSLQTEKLLIAIKKNGSNFIARPDIELMNGIREISPTNSENKGAILGRRLFNLDIDGSVLNPYDVKVYYDVAETDAVLARLTAIGLANPRIVTDKVSFAVLLTTGQPFTSSLWSNLSIPLTMSHSIISRNIDTGKENGVNYVILKQLSSSNLGGTAYVDYILKSGSSISQTTKNGFGFNLFPVPTTDGKVTVEVSSKNLKPITFTVTDMTGRVVAVFLEKHTSLESTHAFDFRQLANGNYQLILSNDEESAIGRFTIEK